MSPPDAVLLPHVVVLLLVVAAWGPTNQSNATKQAGERLHEPILLPLRHRRAELPAVRAQGVLRSPRRRSPILQGKTALGGGALVMFMHVRSRMAIYRPSGGHAVVVVVVVLA